MRLEHKKRSGLSGAWELHWRNTDIIGVILQLNIPGCIRFVSFQGEYMYRGDETNRYTNDSISSTLSVLDKHNSDFMRRRRQARSGSGK